MKFKKGKFLKSLALIGSFGVIASVPIITTSCSSVDENAYMDNLSIKKDAKLFTDFSTLVTGFQENSDMNKAVSKALNTDKNKSILINGYDSLNENQKNSLTVSVDGIQKETETGWGTKAYSEWKNENSLQKIVASTEKKFVVTSLKDLHNQLSNEETLKELLVSAGVKIGKEQSVNTEEEAPAETTESYTISLVSENNIGVETIQRDDLGTKAIDLIHVSVEVIKQSTSDEESTLSASNTEPSTTKYDLAIPASNIDYRVDEVNVVVKNSAKQINEKVNVDLNVGISTTPVSNKANKLEFDSWDKLDTIEPNKFLETVKWTKNVAEQQDGTPEEQTKILDSQKISSDLGIYNVTFSDFTLTPTNGNPGTDTYDGYTIGLKATPIGSDIVWSDGTVGEKQLEIKNTNLVLKDSMLSTFNYSEESPYVMSWKSLFPKVVSEKNGEPSIPFPTSAEELKSKLNDKEFFKTFEEAMFKNEEYGQDFQSVYLEFVECSNYPKRELSDDNASKEYKIVLKAQALKGHEFRDDFKWLENVNLVFKLTE